jgi:hypothetical protein
MNDTMLNAFVAELAFLEKYAGIGGSIVGAGKWLGRNIGEQAHGFVDAAKVFAHPLKSTAEGWAHMAPATRSAEELAKMPGHMSNTRSLGGILSNQSGRGRVVEGAEALSRGGWTGQGKVTKYLPVGMKSWAVLPAAMAVPDIAQAARQKPTPTGEGGAGELAGKLLGSTGSFIAGSRLGVVPGMAAMMLGEHVGGRAGRIVDRLRGGANLRTAVSAPSPQEAAGQMETIQRYYG